MHTAERGRHSAYPQTGFWHNTFGTVWVASHCPAGGTLRLISRAARSEGAAGGRRCLSPHRPAGLGLINGYKDGRFGPNDLLTRGQAAVILWNMAGKPAAKAGAKAFPDVKGDAYYYNAVRWASSAGVVSGYQNGRFGPNDNVTREQFAVMLAHYAKGSGTASDFASMKDGSKVSGWTVSSVGWCFRNKIMSGSKDGHINPQANTTRAETAKMVVFLHDMQ